MLVGSSFSDLPLADSEQARIVIIMIMSINQNATTTTTTTSTTSKLSRVGIF